jgi:hypothetical protein
MSLLSRRFGGPSAGKPESKPEIYKSFRIFAEPVKVAGGFRVAARIEKEIDGEVRTHRMIRADTCDSMETALEITTNKAKMLVDQAGDAIFVD